MLTPTLNNSLTNMPYKTPGRRTCSVHDIIFAPDGNMAGLLQQAEYLRQLSSRLHSCLSAPLSEHCAVSNLADHTLILTATSSAWAARLRYLTPTILEFMRMEADLSDLKTLRIRVLPPESQVPVDPPQQMSISSNSADLLRNIAASTDDPRLKADYLRLANRAK
jgi:hypothetical protein